MKKIIFAVLIITIISSCSTGIFSSKTDYSVLFIGNSFTGYNNMPGMFSFLSDKAGYSTYVDYFLKYGFSMKEILADTQLYEMLEERVWDKIVIQTDYDMAYSYKRNTLIQSLLAFRDSAGIYCDSCEIFLVSVWAPKDGYVIENSDTLSYDEFQNMLIEGVSYAADALEMPIIPSGSVWQALCSEIINYKYDSDGYHPGIAGSYIFACAGFCSIYRNKAAGVHYYGSVEEDEGVLIQAYSDSIILKSMEKWNL